MDPYTKPIADFFPIMYHPELDKLSIQIQAISYHIILQYGGNTLLVQLVCGYLALKPSNTSH